MHILVLTDRDWTHPDAGGTGTSLYGLVSRWLAWGHRVTVLAGSYPGAAKRESPAPDLQIVRGGSRRTVFARAAWRTLRGTGRDADVVLEVVNGIAFFTPLWPWLRAPRVALVHHVHQEHYVTELGRRGKIAAFLLEYLPLRFLYRVHPFVTDSLSAQEELVDLGVPKANIHIAYHGTEHSAVPVVPEAAAPTLLYLGRLKAYKRIEVVLDVLAAIPSAHLEIAGDGDHRAALEADIDRRGLRDRVTLHGFVGEEQKAHLYDRAWVTLTASSAEGWCLTVMEAADRGTPSAALAVGGLRESIVDGQTGLLADTPDELARGVAALVADPERRAELGEAARARARGFTWDATAEATLAVLERSAGEGRDRLRDVLRASETGKAAGLAIATLAANAIQLVFVVIVSRLLGASDYGALAALISAFVVLLVGGQSVQAAAARETALGRLGDDAALRATVAAWSRRLILATVVLTAVGVAAAHPLARLIGTPEFPAAAAAILPTGSLWLLVSLQRGVLQGGRAYGIVGWSIVGEAFGRLLLGAGLVAGGAGVTGGFLASPVSFLFVTGALAWIIHRRLGGGAPAVGAAVTRSLRSLLSDGWLPIVGLLLLAILQNADVIVGRHAFPHHRAGSYAVAATAAKAVIWVAIGVGLQLLPEAARRSAAGLDPRPVLVRALAILGVIAAPALLIFAVAPKLLLKLAFGPKLTGASGSLLLLGAAMTLLAVAYLTVQYMIALGEVRFLWALGAVAILEPFLLTAHPFSLLSYTTVVFGVQSVAASAMLALGFGLHRRRHARAA